MPKPVKPGDIDVKPEAIILWGLEDKIKEMQNHHAILGDAAATKGMAEIAASVDQLHERAGVILNLLGVPIPESDDPQPRSGGGK